MLKDTVKQVTNTWNILNLQNMNNLYGWAMSGCLPYGRLKKLKNVDNFDANTVSEKSPIWYILNVDLKYSDELHVLQF